MRVFLIVELVDNGFIVKCADHERTSRVFVADEKEKMVRFLFAWFAAQGRAAERDTNGPIPVVSDLERVTSALEKKPAADHEPAETVASKTVARWARPKGIGNDTTKPM